MTTRDIIGPTSKNLDRPSSLPGGVPTGLPGLTCALLILALSALGEDYMRPPDPIARIQGAPSAPWISIAPGNRLAVLVEQRSLPALEELAVDAVETAGLRIDPRSNGPAYEWSYSGFELLDLGSDERWAVRLPRGARPGSPHWSPDGRHFVFSNTTGEGIELWVCDTEAVETRRLVGPRLNAAYGRPFDWLPGGRGLICRLVPEDRGPVPEEDPLSGPLIEESLGRKAAGYTWQNLIRTERDERLFEYYCTSELVRIMLDGKQEPLARPSVIDNVSPSPDGRWILVETIHRPYSRAVPAWRFPKRIEVLDAGGDPVFLLADLPLAEEVPMGFGSVREGPRSVRWRNDAPATLCWVEALDGGDPDRESEFRDAYYMLEEPFTGEVQQLIRLELRYAGIAWGRDDTALLYESWRKSRELRVWRVSPGDVTRSPRRLMELDMDDSYGDPGHPVQTVGPWGRSVLLFTPDGGEIYLTGRGATPEGVYPFLDRYELRTWESKRLWRSSDPYYERVAHVLAADASRLILARESQREPRNYFLLERKSVPTSDSRESDAPGEAGKRSEEVFEESGPRNTGDYELRRLNDYRDPAPELAGMHKEVVSYLRADGLELSATLYLPPGHDAAQGEPLPALFWVYPQEFRSRSSAGQVRAAENRFSRPRGISTLFLLTQGYAVISNPALPIVGEGEEEPNDTYIEQLVAGAEAAVEYFVSRGVVDPGRLAIGGHSYGAFTAANLLAHTDLFRTGICRSGAYNRTLTPFGFQGEERNFWEAGDTYLAMSPFMQADRIDEPLLMIHGMEDSNAGTYPMQSERFYDALKGLGANVRLVKLPWEGHGYRSRESAGHVLWEVVRWCDTYLKTTEGPAEKTGM